MKNREAKRYELFDSSVTISNMKTNFLENWETSLRDCAFQTAVAIVNGDVIPYTDIKFYPEFGKKLLPDCGGKDVLLGYSHSGFFPPYNNSYNITNSISVRRKDLGKFIINMVTGNFAGTHVNHVLWCLASDIGEEYTDYYPYDTMPAIDSIIKGYLDTDTVKNRDLTSSIVDTIEQLAIKKFGSMGAAFDWAIAVLELYFWNIMNDLKFTDGVRVADYYSTHKFGESPGLKWGHLRCGLVYYGESNKWLKTPKDDLDKGYAMETLLARAVYMCPASMYPKYRTIKAD